MSIHLKPLDQNIWTVESEQRVLGADFGGRMTVIRLRCDDLFLHSPVSLNEELATELEALGEVKYLIAPNKYHHLHLSDYTHKFPSAEVWGAPGLAKKRKDIQFQGELGSSGAYNWSEELESVFFQGLPFLNEVVFYHPKSKTAIFADLIFNYSNDEGLAVRFYAWIEGVYGRPDFPRLLRFLLRDRKLARESVNRILSWDFDRVSCTHRDVIMSGGKEIISNALMKI